MGSDTSKPADFLQKHKDRQERCRKRLEKEPADHLYFALVGTNLEDEMHPIGESAFLRVVRDAPSVFDLAATIQDKSMLSAVDRYAPQVTHELAVQLAGGDVNVTISVAWAITASLRIRTISDFLVPAAARHSWSTIAGLPADSCSVSLIEDVPRAKRIGPQRPIRADDCEWVAENFRNLISLHDEHAGFRMAVDSFSTHAQHANLRMSVASLWAGIEGLFVINVELRFRLAALIATMLEPQSEARLTLYRRLKVLYDFRSKAVHGGEASEDQLLDHVAEMRFIASRLLTKVIEGKEVPSSEALEAALFAGPAPIGRDKS